MVFRVSGITFEAIIIVDSTKDILGVLDLHLQNETKRRRSAESQLNRKVKTIRLN